MGYLPHQSLALLGAYYSLPGYCFLPTPAGSAHSLLYHFCHCLPHNLSHWRHKKSPCCCRLPGFFSSIHVVQSCGSRKTVEAVRLVGFKDSFVSVFNVATMAVSEDQDLIMFLFVGHHFNLLYDIIGNGKWEVVLTVCALRSGLFSGT